MINFIIIAALVFNHTTLLGLGIKINEAVIFKSHKNGNLLESGVLAAGSIVQIPDRYIKYDKNKEVDIKKSLLNWLYLTENSKKDNEILPTGISLNNQNFEFHFAVKILSAAKGSMVPNTSEVYIPLTVLAIKDKALEVIKDTPVTTVRTPATEDQKTEAQVILSCTDCEVLSSIMHELVNYLPITLTKSIEETEKRESDMFENFTNISTQFEENCNDPKNTKLKTFSQMRKLISEKTKDNPEFQSILLAIMTKESTGSCFTTPKSRPKKVGNIGLFQINTGSSNIKSCTADQIEQIKKSNFEKLKSSPLCLNNPLVNLDEAIKLLKEKERLIFSLKDKNNNPLFDKGKISQEDLTKMVLIAYNYDFSFLKFAGQSLLDFNVLHNKVNPTSDLSVNRWEDLKLFFFRGSLSPTQQVQMFGRYDRYYSEKFNPFADKGNVEDRVFVALAYANNIDTLITAIDKMNGVSKLINALKNTDDKLGFIQTLTEGDNQGKIL